MTHLFGNKNKWTVLTPEEKLDALHESIQKLFSIAEELNHRNHMLVDAVNLIHGRLDSHDKAIHAAETRTGRMEPAG